MKIEQGVIDELVALKHGAKSAAETFGDAVKEQAKKAEIKPAALKRYVAALASDKVADLDAENDAIARLIGGE